MKNRKPPKRKTKARKKETIAPTSETTAPPGETIQGDLRPREGEDPPPETPAAPGETIQMPTEPALQKFGKAGSLKQAAAMMGISAEILKAAKNAGCPGFDDHHRVDCDLVKPWLDDPRNEQLLNSPIARKAMAEARHEELKVERIEYRNGVEKGRYIEKQKISERVLRLAADQTTVLRQKLENEFPTLLLGKSLEEIREECRKLVDQLHGQMQQLVQEWIEDEEA